MSLSALHQHLLSYTRTHTTRSGSTVLNRWCRADEIYAQSKNYFKLILGGSYRYNFDRLALAAIQDLVSLKVLSLQDTSGYKVFRKSPNCYVYLHTKKPSRRINSRSGLTW